MRVLDIGAGHIPFFVRIPWREDEEEQWSPMWHLVVGAYWNGEWTCLDSDESALAEGLKKSRPPPCGLSPVIGDARELPFPDAQFDLVIMSDVLTVPDHDWCMCEYGCDCRCGACECSNYQLKKGPCCGGTEKGLPEKEKIIILEHAIRVLKSGGNLVIANYQTHEYSGPSLKFLETDERLTLAHHIDRLYENEAAGDVRGSYELVYTKS